MKTILSFGASSSTKSINKALAHYTAQQLKNVNLNLLDLNDFQMSIYSIDKEEKDGIPDIARQFKSHIEQADSIIVSFAEHNGSYSTAFKNIMDRCSRMEGDFWANKPMFVLATSPGGRGGKSVLETALTRIPRMGGKIVAQFSLPLFYENFSPEKGIKDDELRITFEEQLIHFRQSFSS